MSWFGNIFSWLSGNKAEPKPKAQRAVSKSRVNWPQAVEVSADGEYSLQWLMDRVAVPAGDAEPLPDVSKTTLKRLARHIKTIPPMPEIWNEIQALLQQPGRSASDFGRCIERDPVLTAHMLTICNSAAYAGISHSVVTNIPLAVARLGLKESTTLLFQLLVPDLGNGQNHRHIRHIWFHAQAVAALSRLLAEPAQFKDRAEVSLYAMLHDIGKLVILHIEPEAKLDALRAMIAAGKASLSAEHETLGYTHIDAGMLLALHWHLPRHVRQFIGQHHQIDEQDVSAMPESAMVNQLAHLVLQQLVADDQPQGDGIWQAHYRHSGPDDIRVLIERLCLPADSSVFYNQLKDAVEHLKSSFTDLFPAATDNLPKNNADIHSSAS
ncbi:MAG: HDOD domain-containing protein [Mariprofundus sp.]